MKYTDDRSLPEISEQQFSEVRKQARPYTVLILKHGPNFRPPGPDEPEVTALIMSHGKRNLRLREAGLMPIICPISDGSDLAGIGVFNASPEDVQRIYSNDPAVQAGVLAFEVHASRSFPGSCIPPAE